MFPFYVQDGVSEFSVFSARESVAYKYMYYFITVLISLIRELIIINNFLVGSVISNFYSTN